MYPRKLASVLITVNPWDLKVPEFEETPSYGILVISQSLSFIFYTGFPAPPLRLSIKCLLYFGETHG